MSDLVGNPEDRFSHNEAHMYDIIGQRVDMGAQEGKYVVLRFGLYRFEITSRIGPGRLTR